MRPVIVLDTETTSLTPDYSTGAGVIWELAMIERQTGTQHVWRVKPDLALADPGALRVGRFYERTTKMCQKCVNPSRAYDLTVWAKSEYDDPEWSSPKALTTEIAPLLDGATIIAANPTFDAGFLTAFLNRHGQAATWHYRLRDIASMAYGWLAGRNTHEYAGQTGRFDAPPIDASTDAFAKALGVDPENFERHTALGDCLLVDAMLDAMGGEA